MILAYQSEHPHVREFEFYDGKASIVVEVRAWYPDKIEYTLEPGNWTIKYFIEASVGRTEEAGAHSFINKETIQGEIIVDENKDLAKITVKLGSQEETRRI
jgi:hypothetical protein